ncbi:MAG: class I SAM-dependent methyltransferase [Myxococcales bacterium]|nr:class I SAM-dependent methyltransferase [Myxococcales bacterium]
MFERTDLDVVVEILGDQDLDVVDVGCGSGGLAHELARRGLRVTGVEPDPQQRALAEARAALPGLTWLAGGASALPCGDGCADAVIFNRSLHHVSPDRMDASLLEAARVLRSGGRLLVLEPDAAGEHSVLMQPFHDESVVRARAQQALDRVQGLTEQPAHSYLRVYTYDDLESFRAKMSTSTVIAVDESGLRTPEVAHRFEVGRTSDGRYRFTNPICVRTFRKVAEGAG